MDTRLHILIAIESFFDGGAEMFAIRLANELALTQRVYFIELYPYLAKEKRQLQLLDQQRVRLIQPGKNFIGDWLYKHGHNERTPLTGFKKKIEDIYQLLKKKRVRQVIKWHKINTVNSHSWDSDVYFAALKKEITFKLVASFHGHYDFLADMRSGFEQATIFTLGHTDAVIYTAPEHRKILDSHLFPEAKRHKIFYGVSMPVSCTLTRYHPATCLNLVMAARGIPEKGWEEAILAVLCLLKIYPGLLKLNLVGEGAFLNDLKIKYQDPAIIFSGYTDNVMQVVHQAHIGLLPTYYIAESLPNTIIEYLVCGKPVITTYTGAIPEMITDCGETGGICIDLENGKVNKDHISSVIENYLINPGLVEKHSEIALQAAEKFTMSTCIANYLNIFNLQSPDKN